jgi:hypothetical protein
MFNLSAANDLVMPFHLKARAEELLCICVIWRNKVREIPCAWPVESWGPTNEDLLRAARDQVQSSFFQDDDDDESVGVVDECDEDGELPGRTLTQYRHTSPSYLIRSLNGVVPTPADIDLVGGRTSEDNPTPNRSQRAMAHSQYFNTISACSLQPDIVSFFLGLMEMEPGAETAEEPNKE